VEVEDPIYIWIMDIPYSEFSPAFFKRLVEKEKNKRGLHCKIVYGEYRLKGFQGLGFQPVKNSCTNLMEY